MRLDFSVVVHVSGFKESVGFFKGDMNVLYNFFVGAFEEDWACAIDL